MTKFVIFRDLVLGIFLIEKQMWNKIRIFDEYIWEKIVMLPVFSRFWPLSDKYTIKIYYFCFKYRSYLAKGQKLPNFMITPKYGVSQIKKKITTTFLISFKS